MKNEKSALEDLSRGNEEISIFATKSKYMKIKKGLKYYYLDPTKYDVSSLMMLLDKIKLNKLEKEFKNHEEGLEKSNFINIMLNELGKDYEDRINLVYGIYKLFLEIDFNGDGTMQWEEFTQFIIDTVMGEDGKGEGEDDDELMGMGKDLSEKQLIKYKRYNVSNLVQDRSLHDTDIIDCQFAPKIDLLFCVEYKSKKLKIYNPKTGKSDKFFDLESHFNSEASKSLSKNDKNKKKKKLDVKQSLTFSILSICVSYFNIVAICTTNKKILFFEFGNDGKAEFKLEINTPQLQKRVWYLPDHNVWMCTGIKKEEDRYHCLYELDVEFEYRQNKWEVLTNIGAKIDEKNYNYDPYKKFFIDKHDGEILDVIEIRKPNLFILTGCMDKKIRLINLNEKEIVKIWTTKINSAVRSLDYNPNIGAGFIISVGFEYYINIWSPVVALDEAHYGTLEGHYSPVITCKFLSGSPMCVSCDEEGNVRIWDCRSKTTLQLIPQEKKNFKVNRLLCLPKYNKFILYGNKIVFFDPKYRDTDIKPKNQKVEENYPIKVTFNKYFLNFFVTTMKDVRIYSSKNGELVKSLKSLRSNVEGDSKIKQFAFDEGDRKFYLGFNNGAIQQFNAGNGSLIKKIGENEEEKDGITYVKYDHSADIVDFFFDPKHLILISCAYDSLINVYDERDPEESTKLRTIRGGHKMGERNNQILAFAFSPHLNIFATGSAIGLITVWDYELSKIDEVCYLKQDKQVDVYSIVFLDPFPMFAASYSDGSIYFWCVKPNKMRGDCIVRGRNNVTLIDKTETFAVYNMIFIYKEMSNIPSRGPVFRQKIPTDVFFHLNSKLKTEYMSKLSEEEVGGKTVIQIPDDEEDGKELDASRYGNSAFKSYLFLGDQKGNIKILDLRGLLRKFEIDKAPAGNIKSTYNILKKDEVNVEPILSHHLQKLNKIIAPFTDISSYMTVQDSKAHEDTITGLSLIDDPFSYVSCSKDKKIKIWSFELELLGELNTSPNLNQIVPKKKEDWKFKLDWEKLKEEEISEVIKIFEELGGTPIKFDESKLEEVVVDYKPVEVKKRQDKIIMPNKRRFKPLEEYKKALIENNDDKENNVNIDDQYHQEIIDNINKVIYPNMYNVGLSEMTRNLLEGNKNIKEEEKEKGNKDKNLVENKTKQKINKIQALNNATFKNMNKNMLYSEKMFKPKDDATLLPDIYKDNLGTGSHNRSSSNVNNFSRKKSNNYNSNFVSKLEKIKRKNEEGDNKNVNVKFKIGETERILSYEYYKSSYDNCCLVGKKGVSNNTLKNNFNLMWNYVQDYSKLIGTKSFKK